MSIPGSPIRRVSESERKIAPEKEKNTMKFLCIFKPSKGEGVPPNQEEMATMGKFIEESFKNGHLIATEGCLPTALGARVRLKDGKFTVTDGPFAEAKEVIGGFALMRFDSKQEAIEYTKKFLQIAGEGESELRQIYEAAAGPMAKQWEQKA